MAMPGLFRGLGTSKMKPHQYRFWCQSARDKFDEREAIMRESNHVPSDAETPEEIMRAAIMDAQTEHNAVEQAAREKARR